MTALLPTQLASSFKIPNNGNLRDGSVFKTPCTPPEGPGSIPSSTQQLTTINNCSPMGSDTIFCVQFYMQTKHAYTNINKLINL